MEISLNKVVRLFSLCIGIACFDAPYLELSLNKYGNMYTILRTLSFDAPYLELSLNKYGNMYTILRTLSFDAPYLELSLNMRQKIREHIYYSQFRCSLSGAFFKFSEYDLENLKLGFDAPYLELSLNKLRFVPNVPKSR